MIGKSHAITKIMTGTMNQPRTIYALDTGNPGARPCDAIFFCEGGVSVIF
jgi:hypothetical protein